MSHAVRLPSQRKRGEFEKVGGGGRMKMKTGSLSCRRDDDDDDDRPVDESKEAKNRQGGFQRFRRIFFFRHEEYWASMMSL